MKTKINTFYTFLLFIVFQINPTITISLDEFLTLTSTQKLRLDELKDRVQSELPHDYMREEVYLLNFLRENDFNVAASEDMMLKMIRWREENKIDEILQEDFSEFKDDYRAYIEGCDNEGRPIVSLSIGDWDIRRSILAGNGEKLKRYTDWVYENAVVTVRSMQKEGQNVTQVALIFDLNGFNVISHACPRCIPIYLYILISLQSHYPGYIHRMTAVNSPSYAIQLWEVFKPVMSPKLKEILEIYGKNRNSWQNHLFQEMSPTELTKQFGGTKMENIDLQELLASGQVFHCGLQL